MLVVAFSKVPVILMEAPGRKSSGVNLLIRGM